MDKGVESAILVAKATISVETDIPAFTAQLIPNGVSKESQFERSSSQGQSNGYLPQSLSEISVGLSSAAANLSEISSQVVSGVLNQSQSLSQRDISRHVGLLGMGMGKSSNCESIDEGEVYYMCSSEKKQPNHSPKSHPGTGSVLKFNCQNSIETDQAVLSCRCQDSGIRSGHKLQSKTSTDIVSNLDPLSETNTGSGHRLQSKNSTEIVSNLDPLSETNTGSGHRLQSKNSTEIVSNLDPLSETNTESGHIDSTDNSSVFNPHSIPTSSVDDPADQDAIDSCSVLKSPSPGLLNTTLRHTHSRNFRDSGHERHSKLLTDTGSEYCPESNRMPTEEISADCVPDASVENGCDPAQPTEITTVTDNTFSFRALSRKQKFIVFSFCIVGFANFLCLSLIAPFFPKEAREKGISNLVSGWIFAAFPLTQFLFAPAFGMLIPVVGLKFMHLSGTFISGGCTVLFGMVTFIDTTKGNEVFIIICFVLRFVLALGCCANQTASYSLCAQEFRDTVGTIFGMGEVFVGLGFMCGPAIGGVLYGFGGFLLPFAVIGGIIILVTLCNYWIVPADDFVQQESSKKMPLLILLKSYKSFVNCLTIAVAAMVWSILDPTLEPHLEEFNLSSELIGVLFLLMAAVYAIASPFWGRVSDKMKDSRIILIFGFVLSAAGLLLLGPSTLLGFHQGDNDLWLNIISLVILGIADSAAIIPTFDLMFQVAEDNGFENDIDTFSMIAGIWGSMYALGDFLGPALGGFLLDEVGFQSMTTYVAIITAVMALILLVTVLMDKPCCCKKKTSGKKSEENAPLLDKGPMAKRYTNSSSFLDTYPPQRMATDRV